MEIFNRYEKETAREYSLRVLKNNIISLNLVPGTILSENELAAELGVSRTPVREALIQLSKSQLVEIYPQRGSVISLIDLELVEESRFLREVLEIAIVEQTCEVATERELKPLTENLLLQEFYLTNHNTNKLMELDNEFHKELFLICKKNHIYKLMEGMTAHFDRLRTLCLTVVKDIKIVQDHKDILAAIKQHDKETAKTTMKKHLSRHKLDENEIKAGFSQYFK